MIDDDFPRESTNQGILDRVQPTTATNEVILKSRNSTEILCTFEIERRRKIVSFLLVYFIWNNYILSYNFFLHRLLFSSAKQTHCNKSHIYKTYKNYNYVQSYFYYSIHKCSHSVCVCQCMH